MADFALGSGDEAEQLANVKDTIAWFRDRYETDPTFRQRVDDAVRRILHLKLRLYGGDFAAVNVIGEATDEPPFAPTGDAAFFDIAEAAITLPVSYTHLDVYKRQPPLRPDGAASG